MSASADAAAGRRPAAEPASPPRGGGAVSRSTAAASGADVEAGKAWLCPFHEVAREERAFLKCWWVRIASPEPGVYGPFHVSQLKQWIAGGWLDADHALYADDKCQGPSWSLSSMIALAKAR